LDQRTTVSPWRWITALLTGIVFWYLSRLDKYRQYSPLLLLAGVILIILLAWGTAIFILNSQNLRCYKITPPLTFAEREILTGKSFKCAETVCRTTIRLGTNGLACFHTRLTYSLTILSHKTSEVSISRSKMAARFKDFGSPPLARAISLRSQPSAAQKSSGHWGYHTPLPTRCVTCYILFANRTCEYTGSAPVSPAPG